MANAWVVFGCAPHRVGGHADQNVSALSERSLPLVKAGFPAGDPLPGPGELTAGDTERWYCCLGGWASCWEPAKCPGSVAGTIPAQAWPCRAAGGHGELASPPLASSCFSPERAGTSCGSGIGPPIKASYLCSFPRALNFACVSGKRAATPGQSTASSQRRESAFNFSSDFPSLFSLIPPAITE